MLLCCCCWPPHLCAISLSALDTALVSLLFYKSAEVFFSRFYHLEAFEVIAFLVVLGLLTCEVLATASLIMAHKRSISRYVWPRLTLLGGQFVSATLLCLLLLVYFSGYSHSANNAFLNFYEYWYGIKFTKDERRDREGELQSYAVGLFVLLFVYAVYNAFEVFITRRYYRSLVLGDFAEVTQSEPQPLRSSEPQPPRPPPFNPAFKPAPSV